MYFLTNDVNVKQILRMRLVILMKFMLNELYVN